MVLFKYFFMFFRNSGSTLDTRNYTIDTDAFVFESRPASEVSNLTSNTTGGAGVFDITKSWAVNQEDGDVLY